MIVTMVYDEDLGNRIRELIASEDGYTGQKTFDGIGFTSNVTRCRWIGCVSAVVLTSSQSSTAPAAGGAGLEPLLPLSSLGSP